MNHIFIQNQDNIYFEKAWQIYLESFPTEERRTLTEQIKLFDKKNFKMLCYVKEEIVIVIVFYWKIEKYTFLEHFAVNSKVRGQSYGSKVLNEFIQNNDNIILEIEPIVNEITKKRLKFYERFDFLINKRKHFQVPFRENAQELKLILMTQDKVFSDDEYNSLYEQMKRAISSEEVRS